MRRYLLPCVLLAITTPVEVYASGDWFVEGNTTLRLESIDTDGLQTASPYPLEGGHHYLELNGNAEYNRSAFEHTRLQFYGVANDSAYRSRDQGLVPERLSLVHEKGDGSIPFRFYAGDFLGYFSYLTLQRSLKGLQLELQPELGMGGQHSVMVFAGENEPEWRHLTLGEDTFSGASWSADMGDRGRYLLNYVHNRRRTDRQSGVLAVENQVWSLGYEKQRSSRAQKLNVRAELGWFDGDHAGNALVAPATDVHGIGFFLELEGSRRQAPFSYVLRAEMYDRDYLPAAAIVPAARRSFEAYGTWRFKNGLRLQGRSQTYRDGVDTQVTTRTETRGVSVTGPLTLLGRVLSSNVDVYRQRIRDNAVNNNVSWVLNARSSATLRNGWLGTLNWFYRNRDDHNPATADTVESLLRTSVSKSLRWSDWDLSVEPGLSYREIRGGSGLDELWPTLRVGGRKYEHEVNAYYGHQVQERGNIAAADTETRLQTASLDYRYNAERHTVGFEAQWFDNHIEQQADTRNTRLAAFWRYSFDKQSTGTAAHSSEPVSRKQSAGARDFTSGSQDLMYLAPGEPLAAAARSLIASGIQPTGVPQGAYIVIEQPWLNDIDLRQRIVLQTAEGTLVGSGVIIEFDDVGNTDSVSRSYQRVRNALIRRYGQPDSSYEEGDIGSPLLAAVNRRQLIRVDEWSLPGGVLRFGIPRRLDGQVRMELQKRVFFNPAQDTLWSFESLP